MLALIILCFPQEYGWVGRWVWSGHGQQLHQSIFAFLSPHQRIKTVGHAVAGGNANVQLYVYTRVGTVYEIGKYNYIYTCMCMHAGVIIQ